MPEIDDIRLKEHLENVIKESLSVYGYDGQNDDYMKDIKVVFGF